MKVDAIVCTKDRPQNLLRVVAMIHREIPCDNIFVYEGSLKPNWAVLDKLKDKYGIKVVLVNGLKFGVVRNLSFINSDAEYIVVIDDDITVQKGWFNGLMREFSDPDCVAVSSKVIFGTGFIRKMFQANTKRVGGSAGAAIYNRKAIIELGNFNKHIHRGEDMELELRIQAANKKWVKSQSVEAYHPVETILEFINRTKGDVVGWNFIMQYSQEKWRFILTRFGSCFVSPVYYFWKTLDPRASGIYFVYKLRSLINYLTGGYLT